MLTDEIEHLCSRGQTLLMSTDYRAAESTLELAESAAWAIHDYDALSRLYMPLQEARRQIRQKAGEGTAALHFIADGPQTTFDVPAIARQFPQSQILLAGWATLAPAQELRRILKQDGQLAEAFLAAAYSIAGGGIAVALVPDDSRTVPDATSRTVDDLSRLLPPHSLILPRSELPTAPLPGTTATFARIARWWEQLHLPYLAAADAEALPARRLAAYRRVLAIDPACELANQKLSVLAREMARDQLRLHPAP